MFIKLTKYIILIDRQGLIFLRKLKGGGELYGYTISEYLYRLERECDWTNLSHLIRPINEIGNSLIFNIIGYIMVNYEER